MFKYQNRLEPGDYVTSKKIYIPPKLYIHRRPSTAPLYHGGNIWKRGHSAVGDNSDIVGRCLSSRSLIRRKKRYNEEFHNLNPKPQIYGILESADYDTGIAVVDVWRIDSKILPDRQTVEIGVLELQKLSFDQFRKEVKKPFLKHYVMPTEKKVQQQLEVIRKQKKQVDAEKRAKRAYVPTTMLTSRFLKKDTKGLSRIDRILSKEKRKLYENIKGRVNMRRQSLEEKIKNDITINFPNLPDYVTKRSGRVSEVYADGSFLLVTEYGSIKSRMDAIIYEGENKNYLLQFCKNEIIYFPVAFDHDGVLLVDIFYEDNWVQEILVEQGLARVCENIHRPGSKKLKLKEELAKKMKLGIWSKTTKTSQSKNSSSGVEIPVLRLPDSPNGHMLKKLVFHA